MITFINSSSTSFEFRWLCKLSNSEGLGKLSNFSFKIGIFFLNSNMIINKITINITNFI